MSGANTPTDPQELRSEIYQTRAELGETVEAPAAKTDVIARAKKAVGEASDQARQKLAAAKDRAAGATERVADTVASANDRLTAPDTPQPARRPLPRPALAAAAAALAGVVVLIRRWRRP
jgi:hypothetical protein